MPEHFSQGEQTPEGRCYTSSVLPISFKSLVQLQTESMMLVSVSAPEYEGNVLILPFPGLLQELS